MGIDLDTLMILTLIGMLLAIFSGVHIALALGATAMIGTYFIFEDMYMACLLYTSPSPRDLSTSRMPSSA